MINISTTVFDFEIVNLHFKKILIDNIAFVNSVYFSLVRFIKIQYVITVKLTKP